MSRLRAGAISALIGFVLAAPLFSSAQNAYPGESLPCTNAHLATQAEADSASPKGSIVAGVTYVCPNDARLGINDDAGNAKDYLRSILCPADGDNYGGMGPDETIRGLDAKFAVCAESMLKALNNGGGLQYCIKEGKRSVAKQQEYVNRGVIACKRGAMCEHPRGIAIDINVKGKPGAPCSDYARAHQSAPSYGLTFYMGCKDAYHFVPQKSGCTAGGTVANYGSTNGSSFPTGGTNNPNAQLPASFYDNPQYAPAGAGASPFNMPLNQLQPQSSAPTQTSPYNTSGNYNTYDSSDILNKLYATSSTSYSPYTFNAATATRRTDTGPSAADQIAQMGGTNTGSSGSTGSSVPTSASGTSRLNDDLYDIVSDSKTGGSNSEELAYADTRIAENSVAVNPIHVTETFTGTQQQAESRPAATSSTNAGQTLLVALLTTLRDLLRSYLSFLLSHKSAGFQAPWQPQNTQVYR